MHVIIVLDQSPKTIRHTVYGADNVFILIKRSVLCGAVLNLFPELLRKFSAGRYIVIGIYHPLFLAGKIKGYAVDFDEKPGYAGVPNPLYTNPKTVMKLGDAKQTVAELIAAF